MNYIRSRVRENSPPSAIPRKDAFQDEKYLQPVLQDDALLYNVDEIIEDEYQVPSMAASAGDSDLRVLQAKVAELQEAMQRVSSQYADYRSAVKGVMNARLEAQAAELPLASSDNAGRDGDSGIDTAYFDSYSYHGRISPPIIMYSCLRVWLTSNDHSQKSMRPCSKTLSGPMLTEILSTRTSTCSAGKLFWMWAAVQAFCPCSAPRPGRRR